MNERCRVGVIGCGDISGVYLNSLVNVFNNTEVTAVSSLNGTSAKKRAEQFHISKACSTEDLLASDIDIAVVLTTPVTHYSVVKDCLLAGKNTYVEKPISITTEQAKELLALAKEKNVMLTCAPDTLLGAGTQTCRKLIEDGLIGIPIASVGQTLNGGPEPWHPNPFFFYKKGAGPLYDVGPYYIGDILYLFGPARSVCCMAKTTYATRTIGSELHRGEKIDVEVPTYYACTIQMESGEICTSLHSFDVPNSRLDTRIEIYGTEGTMLVSPPCDFDGEILFKGHNSSSWQEIKSVFEFGDNSRGLGVADMADAMLHGRKPRLSAEFAYHTLDVIECLQNSFETNTYVTVSSTFEKTSPMPQVTGWAK